MGPLLLATPRLPIDGGMGVGLGGFGRLKRWLRVTNPKVSILFLCDFNYLRVDDRRLGRRRDVTPNIPPREPWQLHNYCPVDLCLQLCRDHLSH